MSSNVLVRSQTSALSKIPELSNQDANQTEYHWNGNLNVRKKSDARRAKTERESNVTENPGWDACPLPDTANWTPKNARNGDYAQKEHHNATKDIHSDMA